MVRSLVPFQRGVSLPQFLSRYDTEARRLEAVYR